MQKQQPASSGPARSGHNTTTLRRIKLLAITLLFSSLSCYFCCCCCHMAFLYCYCCCCCCCQQHLRLVCAVPHHWALETSVLITWLLVANKARAKTAAAAMPHVSHTPTHTLGPNGFDGNFGPGAIPVKWATKWRIASHSLSPVKRLWLMHCQCQHKSQANTKERDSESATYRLFPV